MPEKRLQSSFFHIFAAIFLIFLVAACKKHNTSPTEQGPVKVGVTVVGIPGAPGDGNPYPGAEYSGTVSASTTTMLSFSVPGTIVSLPLEEGQNVSKGQVLGTLESGDYENASNISQAQLAEAQDAYQRLKKLHDANALPDIKWVEIQQKLKQAENAAQLSKRTLSDATLRSPISGTVSRKLASVGQNVVPGEPVYEIVSSGSLTIDITVPENEISAFAPGQKALISFEALPEPVEGEVTRKSVVADPLTRGYTVKVSLPTSKGKILPGMVGNVVFASASSGSKDNAKEATLEEGRTFILPAQAVQLAADNRNFVWVVKDGTAIRKWVIADELVAHGVIIKDGLTPGDTVIVEGMRKVGTGTPVTVTPLNLMNNPQAE